MLFEKESSAVGTAQQAQSVYLNVLRQDKDYYSFLWDLVFSPDFRKIRCIDCSHHKPFYICQKCHAESTEVPGVFMITLKGKKNGRVGVSDEMRA